MTMARQIPHQDLEEDENRTLTYERRSPGLTGEQKVREVDVTIQNVCDATGVVTAEGEREEFRVHVDGNVYGRRAGTTARRVLTGCSAEFQP